MYRYSLKYRRLDDHSSKVYRMTVTARNADEARIIASLRDTRFSHTVSSPRRGAAVQEPEQADGMTAAKARDDLRDGVAHFAWGPHDIEVEVL